MYWHAGQPNFAPPKSGNWMLYWCAGFAKRQNWIPRPRESEIWNTVLACEVHRIVPPESGNWNWKLETGNLKLESDSEAPVRVDSGN